ncbi:MAG: flippase [Candidatus Pseudobacter hemicellulosilyticus]|uniref:Flippase n=1 Tax=Candidatus Pseudobacter hemicellulosilyticus TaxID=3121375 RepID=A0AAJ6BIS2_9BACT|nr:MAG: flippase [Pseudobacter sp.]
MNNKPPARLWENFTALGIVQGTNFILPLLVIPYVIRVIGADGFGIVSIAQVIMMFLSTIADFGFNLTATREISLNRENATVVSRVFFSVVFTRLLICAVLFLLLLAALALMPQWQEYSRLYLLAFVTVLGQSLLMNWLFQGMERMRLVMYISLLARIVFVALVFLFIRTKEDKDYFIFFTGVGNLLAGLMSIWVAVLVFRIRWVMPSWARIWKELKDGWHIMVSNLSVSVFMYTNVVILGVFASKEMVGYYSVAEKVVMAARQLLSVYFQVIYPQVVQLAQRSKQELHGFLRKNYLPFLGAVLMGCTVLLLFPEFIVSIFLHENQAVAAVYLRVMSFVPFVVCLNIPVYQLLLAHNEKKSLLRIFLTGSLINIIMNSLLAHWLGAMGTCITVVCTELLITTALVMAANKKENTRPLRLFL